MLKVNNIHCGYDNIEVLKGISFEIPKASIVSIIGANGAGKTTTIRAISRLIKLNSGSIMFEDTDLGSLQAHDLVKFGISQVPEGRQVFPELTVAENLEMGGYMIKERGKLYERTEQMYQKFPILKERYKQLAGTLWGGEQQMLAISRALISDPKLILLDEPSMGLSPKLVSEVFDIIEQLKSEKITVLLVEQNAAMALYISDYAYALQNGEIILSGPGLEMMDDPRIKMAYLA